MVVAMMHMTRRTESPRHESAQVTVVLAVRFKEHVNPLTAPVGPTMDAAAIRPSRMMVVNDRVGKLQQIQAFVKDSLQVTDKAFAA